MSQHNVVCTSNESYSCNVLQGSDLVIAVKTPAEYRKVHEKFPGVTSYLFIFNFKRT